MLKGSELIKNFVEHFKNPEAATRPLPIPDPMFMPDRIYPILTLKVSTTNVTAFGVSHIRVRNFTSDAVKMKVTRISTCNLLYKLSHTSLKSSLSVLCVMGVKKF